LRARREKQSQLRNEANARVSDGSRYYLSRPSLGFVDETFPMRILKRARLEKLDFFVPDDRLMTRENVNFDKL